MKFIKSFRLFESNEGVINLFIETLKKILNTEIPVEKNDDNEIMSTKKEVESELERKKEQLNQIQQKINDLTQELNNLENQIDKKNRLKEKPDIEKIKIATTYDAEYESINIKNPWRDKLLIYLDDLKSYTKDNNLKKDIKDIINKYF